MDVVATHWPELLTASASLTLNLYVMFRWHLCLAIFPTLDGI